MKMSDLKPANEYSTYEAYCAPRRQVGLGVMPESLYNAILEEEQNDLDLFVGEMRNFCALEENVNADGSINWNFIDSEMYMKWSVKYDGEMYERLFNQAADIIEGVSND